MTAYGSLDLINKKSKLELLSNSTRRHVWLDFAKLAG
jgi:hypothetical protein